MTSRIVRAATARDGALDAMIARHAAANGLPIELVHRVVIRESRYNPRARNGSNLGLMQIKHATARGVGYAGPASGLLDAETNLTYAVRYLAGAYRAAGGNPGRAVAYYASGYHGRGVARSPVVTAQAAPAYQPMQAMPVAMRDTDMIAYAPKRSPHAPTINLADRARQPRARSRASFTCGSAFLSCAAVPESCPGGI